ncbi:DUF2723 domain-containing protein [Bacteroides sp. 519]|uniref:glycosyltransferase family 117 protein n=1 Tax=Bacteroides sp. 519 TaxID=2302937 RepID=UPI0013D04BC0|nr:DUF2723 domain-containing protein [Bacteroides sp. 519]NDV59190.1 DUF2723 domain-containing protein [Bacteroides sp. 519]
MKSLAYKHINNLTGFLVFCISATVYCLTVEPTASFWDCGEFIISGYKLEVGHAPGAPFFMLTANVFTQFTNDPALVARMVNYMSAIMSAATIWLLYLSITHLTRKLICSNQLPDKTATILTIVASGVVGALAYTFSDTFWFSAVEGEVYAYSSLFTALVFWLILKWEDEPDPAYSDRWIVLIAYLIGLSIGVHLLNLLCLPAIVLVYYYKKHPNSTLKGTLSALIVSGVLIAVILYGIVPGVLKVGGWFELLFVNRFGMPFHTGLTVFLVLFAGMLIWGIYKSRNRRVISTGLLCLAVFMIGYSSYALIMIRSTANTPMDQNSPEDIFTLDWFLGRKQYGDRPLLYGPSFLSEPAIKEVNGIWMYDYKEGDPIYRKKAKDSEDEKDSYVIIGNHPERVYTHNMLFPRMYKEEFADVYRSWVDVSDVPTQWENFKFFLTYQLNFMYWRYFMWNFVGRQNDIQGNGEIEHGNWITGIPFIDNLLIGNQELMPTELKENKGRNVYYGLPLLLGIIGLLWQTKRGQTGQHSFFIVFMLFFMTGIAIIMYLNQTPMQVRERDYAYAGSFYAYAIWIGMGVAGIIQLLKARMKELPATIIASVLCLLIPIQMASQTWDDHDRSGRYSCRDIGQNYLMSAEEGNYPVIWTMGDNDSFPLWYNQEVEGFRTDARPCNVAYLYSDWYIDAMKRDQYNSPGLPIPWEHKEYMFVDSEIVSVKPELKKFIDRIYETNPEDARKEFGDNPYEAQNILRYWVRSEDKQMRVIPTDSLVIKLDKEAIRRSGMKIPEALNGEIPDYMHLSLKGRNYVTRSELMMLETVIGCNWERPVYLATSVGSDGRFCFENNFCREGLLYRVTPFDTQALDSRIDTERTYDCLMNKFKWGGIEDPNVYMDETALRMYHAGRATFVTLAEALIREGKHDKALNVLNHCRKVIPHESLPYDYKNSAIQMAEQYYNLGEKETADEIMNILAHKSVEYATWYLSMQGHRWYNVAESCMTHLYLLNEQNKIMAEYQSELLNVYGDKFSRLYEMFERKN